MDYRLKGKTIEFVEQGFISEGIGLGIIQIPADGRPMALIHDR